MILKTLSIIIIIVFESNCTTVTAIKPFNQTTTQIITIYSSSSALTNNTFNISYTTAKTTTPQVISGIIGFRDISDMSQYLFKASITSVTTTQFTIQTDVEHVANIIILKISYIATNDIYDNIYIVSRQYNIANLSQVNTGSGLRTSQISQTFFFLFSGSQLNSNNSKNYVASFINGFQINTQITFQLSISVIIQNSISFMVYINTAADCSVSMVYVSFLFINLQLWEGNNLVINLQTYEAITNNTKSSDFSYNYLNTQNFIFGLNGIQILLNNVTVQSYINFQRPAPLSNNFQLTNTENIVTLRMNFIFIAQLECDSNHSYFTDNSYYQCTDQCLQGQTSQPTNNVCTPCNSKCSSCTLNLDFCTSCLQNYQLSSSNTCDQVNNNNNNDDTSGSSFPIYIIAIAVGAIILIIAGIGIYFYFRRPSRTLFEQDIRMHPSIDIV